MLDVLRRDHDLPLLVVDRLGRRLAGTALDADVDRAPPRRLARRPPPLEVELPGAGAASVFLVEGAMGDVDAGLFCLRPLRGPDAPPSATAIDQAARFLSLEVTKQQALQAIESRFSSELLEMILSGPARSADVQERLRAFGIDPSAQLAVITMVVGDDPVRPAGSTDEIEDFFTGGAFPRWWRRQSGHGGRDFRGAPLPELVELAHGLVDAVTKRFPAGPHRHRNRRAWRPIRRPCGNR